MLDVLDCISCSAFSQVRIFPVRTRSSRKTGERVKSAMCAGMDLNEIKSKELNTVWMLTSWVGRMRIHSNTRDQLYLVSRREVWKLKKLILLRKTVKSGHFESMVLRDGRAKNSDPWRNAYRVEGSLRPYAYRNFGLHPQWVRDRWNLNLCRFHPPHKKVKFRSNSPKPSRHGLPFGQWIDIDKL